MNVSKNFRRDIITTLCWFFFSEKIVDPSSEYTRRGMLFKICPQRNLHDAEIFCSVVDGNGETVSHIGLPNPIEYRECKFGKHGAIHLNSS